MGVPENDGGATGNESAIVFGRERREIDEEFLREGAPGPFIETGREAAIAAELFFEAWGEIAATFGEPGRQIGGGLAASPGGD